MSNWLGSSDAASINVTKIHTVAPDVKIPGSPSRGVRTAEGIALTGSVVASGCASAPRVQGSRVYYAWEQTVPVPASAGGDAPDLVAEASRGWAELCFESRESTWHVPTGIASFCALKTVRKGLSLLGSCRQPAIHTHFQSSLACIARRTGKSPSTCRHTRLPSAKNMSSGCGLASPPTQSPVRCTSTLPVNINDICISLPPQRLKDYRSTADHFKSASPS